MELCEIKGIGKKRLESLNEMGIFTPSDLLLRFPDKYIYKHRKIDGSIQDGAEISFVGEVATEAKRRFIRRGLSVVSCSLKNNGVTVWCYWFNQPFAARSLKAGDAVYAYGKVKKYKSTIRLTNPTLLTPQEGDGDVIPIYKTRIPSRTFASAVQTALCNVAVNSFLPRDLAEKYDVLPLNRALLSVHSPKSEKELAEARRSVAIENMCYVITSYRLIKDDRREHLYNADLSYIKKYEESLPYELTDDQKSAIDRIIGEMRSDRLMNILVQGEVGCGKTAIALCAMYYAAMSGYQAAIMTPTEVLARQHYDTMVKILEPLGVRVQLLCASMNKTQRETALFNLKYGAASCIVGTQSLLSDEITFNDLRLVIVDEQQRFGVNQRAKLESKAKKTDMIVMTATPIPRTLALSLYGELKQIEVRGLPSGRPKVHTSIVPQAKIGDMYEYIAKCADRDERTYVICPRITDGDDETSNVELVYSKLKNSRLSEVSACVHGKMRDADKQETMNAFKSGRIKVLVSTTVVEVGIDVPEATNVIIYDAERFGLSQLHQIRGRVGRGTKQSYCFLLCGEEISQDGLERLKKFCAVSDGFSVSELDFKLRGAGDFIGLRQHGSGSLEIDESTIVRARELSDALIEDGRSTEALIRSLKNPEFIRSVTMN